MTDTKSAPLLTINCQAIAANYQFLNQKSNADCQTAAVIKADCYGLGIKEILPVFEAQNCPFYFVATIDEGIQARRLTDKPIAILNGAMPNTEKELTTHDLIPVINSPVQLERWQNTARDKPLPTILHFDTGMNRLGFTDKETAALLNDPARYEGLQIKTIMSHFACADEKDHALTQQQARDFDKIAQHFPATQKSLCNSSGIFTDSAHHYDLTRPGMALYGLNPVPYKDNPVQPVVTLEAPILQVKKASKNTAVGYGATYKFGKDTNIAIIALGYADGFLRSLSNKGHVYYGDHKCPVVGRVSMDLVIIDLSGIGANTQVKEGDMVEIIGPHQSADALAAKAGTIGYEIFTALGARYRRSYRTG